MSSYWWTVSLCVVSGLSEKILWIWASRVKGGEKEGRYNVARSVIWGVVLHEGEGGIYNSVVEVLCCCEWYVC